MPAPALASLAKRAGVSMERAEKLWSKAKAIAKKAGREEDWPYIMGILKKSLKIESKVKLTADFLIESVLEGKNPKQALDYATQYGKWYARMMSELGHKLAKQSGDPCNCDKCLGLPEN